MELVSRAYCEYSCAVDNEGCDVENRCIATTFIKQLNGISYHIYDMPDHGQLRSYVKNSQMPGMLCL